MRSAGDYRVGKGRPPLATRWKPGQSGNLRGRPKGTKNLTTILEQALSQKLQVRDKGKTRQISALEAIARRLVHDAVKGDLKAIKLLLGYEPEIARKVATFDDIDEITGDDDAARSAQAYLRLVRA